MRKIFIAIMFLSPLLFSGCIGKIINIGEEKGYCEEHGCDYSDAGVCGNVYELYRKKNKVSAVAYRHIECNCEGEFDVKK